MSVFVWRHDLDPEFPLSILEYETGRVPDRMHWHDHLEIALCLGGRGSFHFGPRSCPARPGDIFLIDNTEPHVALAETGRSLRMLLFLFRPELIAPPGCRGFDAGYLLPFRNSNGTSSDHVPGGSTLAAEVAPMLLELREIWDRHESADRHLLDASLRRPLGHLIRHRLGTTADPGVLGAAWREQMRPVLEFVDGHFCQNLTLDQVAEHVHVSASRIRHLFKETIGLGFKEYVTNLRLSEAKRLLLATDASISEIAHAVSYTNIRQFYTVFHRFSDMSPGEYRRAYLGATPADPEPAQTISAEASLLTA